mmetsp:Transcript_8353/g.18986  ORF Transcript_8353/g.18986 Transcript_8353/m.18986 type:complete len:102 (-) Transcript_8353:933-1238(-)
MRTIHCRSNCNGFIWVDPPAQFLVREHFLKDLLHLGDATGTSDEQHLVDVVCLHTTVNFLERPHDRQADSLQQVAHKGLELVAGHLGLQGLVLVELVEANV